MALTGSLSLKYSGEETSTFGFSTVRAAVDRTYSWSMSSGTGAEQGDVIWHAQRTITASANDDLDLAGVLTGALGAVVTFAKVKMILVSAAAGNTNNVIIGNAAATQFVGPFGAAAHTITLGPGDMFLITRRNLGGLTVGAGSSDILRLTNSAGGTSVVYDIVIVGTSA